MRMSKYVYKKGDMEASKLSLMEPLYSLAVAEMVVMSADRKDSCTTSHVNGSVFA